MWKYTFKTCNMMKKAPLVSFQVVHDSDKTRYYIVSNNGGIANVGWYSRRSGIWNCTTYTNKKAAQLLSVGTWCNIKETKNYRKLLYKVLPLWVDQNSDV